MTIDLLHLAMLVLAGFGGGFANSLAGGGTLITFPALLAAGLPPVIANVTSTVALCPGYLGGILAQLGDLKGQGRRLALLVPVSVLGSAFGGWVLLSTGEKSFVTLVPWLLLMACALMGCQDPIRRWLDRRAAARGLAHLEPADNFAVAMPTLTLAAVYGGYFGPGVSVMFMAVLGLVLVDTLTRLNALKSALGLAVNIGAAVLFIASGKVAWVAVIAVAAGALAGGAAGGRLAAKVRPATLRKIVIGVGLTVSAVLFVRG